MAFLVEEAEAVAIAERLGGGDDDAVAPHLFDEAHLASLALRSVGRGKVVCPAEEEVVGTAARKAAREVGLEGEGRGAE